MRDGPHTWGVIRTLLATALGLMLLLAAVAHADGNPAGAKVLGLGAAFVLPSFLVRSGPGRAYWVASYLGAVLIVVIVGLSWVRGGVHPTLTLWLTLLPVVASMLGGRRSALGWCTAVLLAITGLGVAEWLGALPPRTSPSLLARWISQVGFVVLSLWLVFRVRLIASDRQKLLSEQAVAGQKLESLGRLAGGIAHDFNNVLAVVLARVDDALYRFDPSDEEYVDLEAIRTAAKRGASLASELVAFSRRGPATYDVLRPVDIVRAAEQVLGRLVRETVRIETHREGDVPAIEGDRDHLLQVLLNLALNAQDAMPHGGRVRISVWSETIDDEQAAATGVIPSGKYAVISVADEGTGMTPEVQARVFEPFFTTKERGQGSGIGLATVHAIMTQHGGHVRLTSKVGEGSTFELVLPLTARSGELAESTDEGRMVPGPSSLRLLLVEDDVLVRRALEVMLSRAGHVVVAAKDGDEALTRWTSAPAPFDVLLTDVLMPGMTGPDVARRLRSDDASLPVVYMSGHVEDAMRDVDLAREQAIFVRKPASRAALLDALARAVATPARGQPVQTPTSE